MIRILLLTFILVSFSSTQAQDFFPQNYKLSTLKFSPRQNTQKDKFLIPVTPTTSKFPSSNFITDIIVQGDTVWFATGSGVMRTIDNFQNFQSYFDIPPFNDDDVSGLTVNSNVVVVSTAVSEEISGELIPVGTGIKVSTDGGANFEAYNQPVDGNNDTVITYGSNNLPALPVVVPQQNLSYDIEVTRRQNDSTNFTIWITSFAGGVRKSDDYGVTWQRVLLPSDELDSIYPGGTYNFALDPRENLNHRAFTIEAVNDSVLYVGTADGINRSTDWGVSWRKFNFQNTDSNATGNGVSGNFIVNLHVQYLPSTYVIWAASRRAEDNREFNALSFSSNGGVSWRSTLDDLSANNIASYDSLVYGLTNEGLWRANFGVFDWSKPGLIVDEQTNDVLRSDDFFSGNHIGDTLYFGSSDGLLRTIETGQPWASKWKIFRSIQPIDLGSDIQTYAAPNPFAPDDEAVRIFYKTGKPSAKVTIKIFDFGMQPVRTVIQNAQRTSSDELFTQWDGKNDEGRQAANGVYFYRVQVDGEDEYWGKIIVLQ